MIKIIKFLAPIIIVLIFYIFSIFFSLGIFYFAVNLVKDTYSYTEERRAIAECEKWIDWSLVYPNFFLTQWQYDQCSSVGVIIDTKIIK